MPMPIIVGLVLVFIIFFVARSRQNKAGSLPDTDTGRPDASGPSILNVPNDKLVEIGGVTISDLEKVLAGFCNMYNQEKYQAQPRLTEISERRFAISFPYEIQFEIFCYFVNYLVYPRELNWKADVTAWTTTHIGDSWISEDIVNSKVMLFVPEDDLEHDNVYMTTSNNMGYKLGFAMSRGKHLADGVKRLYRDPFVNASELAEKAGKEFK